MTQLKDKVAIVTGSTSGIGAAIARMLSEHQVNVVINSASSVDQGKSLANKLGNSIYCQADIGKEADCKKLIDTTVSYYGRLDFLINNAGLPGEIIPSMETPASLTNEQYGEIVTVDGGFALC